MFVVSTEGKNICNAKKFVLVPFFVQKMFNARLFCLLFSQYLIVSVINV